MGNKVKSKDSVVKIDSSLHREIEEFITKEENRLKFVNRKQFVDLAVHDFLERVKKKSGGKD